MKSKLQEIIATSTNTFLEPFEKMWQNGSDSRVLVVNALAIPVGFPVFHTNLGLFRFLFSSLIKQPNGSFSRTFVQAYMWVKWVAVSVHSEAGTCRYANKVWNTELEEIHWYVFLNSGLLSLWYQNYLLLLWMECANVAQHVVWNARSRFNSISAACVEEFARAFACHVERAAQILVFLES